MAKEYIEKEALRKIIHEHHYRLADAHNSRDWGMFTIGIDQAIDECPAANVRENVTGEWIRIGEHEYECSVCKDGLWNPEIKQEKYCFNCGAKMY